MFGWNFDGLALAIQERLQQCIQALADIGDVAMQRGNNQLLVVCCIKSLNPSNRAVSCSNEAELERYRSCGRTH
jgi:hypothetical protein